MGDKIIVAAAKKMSDSLSSTGRKRVRRRGDGGFQGLDVDRFGKVRKKTTRPTTRDILIHPIPA